MAATPEPAQQRAMRGGESGSIEVAHTASTVAQEAANNLFDVYERMNHEAHPIRAAALLAGSSLIAAAPNMLAALSKVSNWYTAASHQDRDGGMYLNGDSKKYPGDAWDDLEKIDAEIQAAIAQATLPAAHGNQDVQAHDDEASQKGNA